MAIPNFDHNHVLPPHIGDQRDASQLSPYPATSEEICRRFATSHDRCIILRGWLEFRSSASTHGAAFSKKAPSGPGSTDGRSEV
jgi:hypothetical protein